MRRRNVWWGRRRRRWRRSLHRRWRNGPRRWRGCRRRLVRRWRSLRQLLGRLSGLSIGTKLLLGLCHDQRRGLRVRRSRAQLQRRESCRGKQQELKFCHDGSGLRKILRNKICQQVLTINKQALGRIVAAFKPELVYISDDAKSGCVSVHCAFRSSFQICVLQFAACGYWQHSGYRVGLRCRQFDMSRIGRGRGGVRSLRSAHRQFARCLARQLVWRGRLIRLLHGGRHLGPRSSGRIFRRWLRRLAGPDRRVLWRVDRHLAISGIS